ncbi:hypothetical protein GCM10011369_18320 [Neiella marina]|uniref:Nitrogen fixation protein NifQ n=1 Tax=Neiella marina TaxID=508461 RepID=A0A8J2U4S9_9GAMM|nr:nitrogen fixation protein NifQ [Neiella marina]GGA76743.1 hypothetical protein GCM10011369_18320 [Neiella marina]
MFVSVSARTDNAGSLANNGTSAVSELSQLDANQLLIGVILAQLEGRANLPYGLGLSHEAYHELLLGLADESLLRAEKHWQQGGDNHIKMRAKVLAELLAMQLSEREELVCLLADYTAPDVDYSDSVAIIVATASLSPAHLWKSLGLVSRQQLRQLLSFFFPQLVALNHQNMRWKRFFYRCLCERSGDYVCKSPNCVDCSSYQECFSPE